MKKRLVSVALVAALAAGTLAGCGSSSSGDNTQAAAGGETAGKGGSSDENITLRFAWWGGDERNEATLKVIEQFEAAHPNITIEAEYGGSDGYHDKLATQLASGTAADIVQVDPEVFPTYVSTGDYFIDYKDYDMDLSNFDENYISLEINGRYDGKQLGLPTGISGSGMLVVGLASVIIGEVIVGKRGLEIGFFSSIFGSIIYRYIIAAATKSQIFPAYALKLVSACIVAAALALPAIRYQMGLSKMKRTRERDMCE